MTTACQPVWNIFWLYVHIYNFCVVVCYQSYQTQMIFDRSIWPVDGTLKDIITPDLVDLAVMVMKKYSTFTISPEMESHDQVQFSAGHFLVVSYPSA